MANKRRYILTIEYNMDEDRCEFIEERIIDESPDNNSLVIGTIDLEDYFTDSDIAGLDCCTIGKT